MNHRLHSRGYLEEAESILFNIEEATLGRAYLKNVYNEFRKCLQR